MAVKYLKKVLEIEQEMFTCETQQMDMAQTYSNICSIYSEMDKHEIALSYSRRAVEILQKEYDMRM